MSTLTDYEHAQRDEIDAVRLAFRDVRHIVQLGVWFGLILGIHDTAASRYSERFDR